MKEIKAKIEVGYVDVKAGRETLVELIQSGVHPKIIIQGRITHAVNRCDGISIGFGMRVDASKVDTTEPIKAEIHWAFLDVKPGRFALRKLVERCIWPNITLEGQLIHMWNEDDGVSQGLAIAVETSKIEAAI